MINKRKNDNGSDGTITMILIVLGSYYIATFEAIFKAAYN